ncbi:protein of unknown function [Burkholderia multivorans]
MPVLGAGARRADRGRRAAGAVRRRREGAGRQRSEHPGRAGRRAGQADGHRRLLSPERRADEQRNASEQHAQRHHRRDRLTWLAWSRIRAADVVTMGEAGRRAGQGGAGQRSARAVRRLPPGRPVG